MGKRIGKQIIDGAGRPIINLMGKTFGLLRVLKFIKIKNNKTYWQCLCECGKRPIIRASCLISGNTKSCGCLRSKKVREYNINRRMQEPWLAEMNVYIYRVGWDQRKRNSNHKTWSLTVEQYKKLCTSLCFYCGQEPAANPSTKRLLTEGIKKNGIDRIDSSKGYEPDNCVSCCGACNKEKGSMTMGEFIAKTTHRFFLLKK